MLESPVEDTIADSLCYMLFLDAVRVGHIGPTFFAFLSRTLLFPRHSKVTRLVVVRAGVSVLQYLTLGM